MRLYILGKNGDDKGTQLEQLTARILDYQGLENIQTNIQGAGGNEIDITAYKSVYVGLKQQIITVIGECKAYSKPIDTEDWMKFFAKIEYEKRNNPHTIGMMICLSGANGPVMGIYNEKHKNDETIQLIANNDLIKLLSSCYNFESEGRVRERLVAFSYADIFEINLLYYNRHLYWAISFMDGKYTVSHADGQPMGREEFGIVSSFIGNYSPYISDAFVDIRELYNVQRHLTTINIVLLTVLANGFNGTVDDASKQVYDLKKNGPVDKDVLLAAIKQNPFVSFDPICDFVKLKDDKEIDIVGFYRYIILQGCPVELLASDYYQKHINNELLDKALEMQFGLVIPEEKRDDCLFLMKHSPSALFFAITPNPFFRGFAAMKDQHNMKVLYVDTFLRKLTEGFLEDFQRQELNSTFYHQFKITNLRTSSEINITVNGQNRNLNYYTDWELGELAGANQVVLMNKCTIK